MEIKYKRSEGYLFKIYVNYNKTRLTGYIYNMRDLHKYAQSSAISSIWTNVIQNQYLADITYIICMDGFVATNS